MPIEVLMPALSPTMSEGTLARWCKHEGDAVVSGDVLAEIETDKATMEIEAIDDGVLAKILIDEGSEGVAVNTVIALILEEGDDTDPITFSAQSPPTPQKRKPSPLKALPETSKAEVLLTAPLVVSKSAVSQSTGRILASPLARRIAIERGLDLGEISGSGPHGRIVRRDVENRTPQKTIPAKTATSKSSPTEATTSTESYSEPLSTMRKIIAARLTESKQTIPHFYLSADCRIDRLLVLREEINADSTKENRISVNDLIIKASATALMRQERANACFDGDAVRYFNHADIAIAVSIPDGLITPVIRRADTLSLSSIARISKDLARRARAGKLLPEEYQGGSFSISNLGMFGVDQFQAVINPPHACILAVGRGRSAPIVLQDNSLGVGTLMNLTLSVDHRAVDGALAAKLLEELKKLIENPVKMLI